MPYIPNEALTREQGEQIIDVLKGEEPKEYGYPYTNEVLNKEQGDRIIKALKNFHPSGGGLPDPSTLSDGTAAVVVNGEWKMQDGYGYTEQIEQTVITWDGDTEGRETLMPDFPYYKVSDNGVPASFLIGATIVFDGNEVTVTQDMISEIIDGVVMAAETVISVVDAVEFEGITLNKGIYFIKDGRGKYVSSLTYGGDIVHKIAQKYMPSAMVEVRESNTYDEVLEILNSGLIPYIQLSRTFHNARLYVSSVEQERIYFGSPAIFSPFGAEENPSSSCIENFSRYVDEDGWSGIVRSNSVEFQTHPYEDGTYVLTCTRTNGSDHFGWKPAT